MNDNDAILAELRKISAWAEWQRKISRRSLIFLAVFFPAIIVAAIIASIVADKEIKTTIAQVDAASWYDVDRDVRSGNYDTAIRIGEELIQKTAQDPDAHRRLANAYLAAGKLDKAREHFAEAVRLFPSEENEKSLAAMDARIKAGEPQP
jgi:tetratricopeptide (TPR) repeat protein